MLDRPHAVSTSNVFTYGTLVIAEVMEAVTGRRFASVPARLDGYERVCVRGAVYPAARAADGGTIDGVLWLDVDARALDLLDLFEGDLYERRSVRVTTSERARDAQVYVVPERHAARLDPRPWDLAAFRTQHLARYLARCRSGDVAPEG